MEGVSSSEERCAMVGELVQVLEMARQLDAHMMAGKLGAGGEEQCRALVAAMRTSIDRSVHMARSFYIEASGGRLPPVFAGQPESPPSGPSGGGGDGSPRSAGSDQARGQSKKRKTPPKWSTKVRVSAVQDVTPLDDGLSWRKYGQKDILGAKYPRAYFRCTHRHTQGCQASKQVQRADGDPLLFNVVYHGDHTCAQAQAAAHLGNHAETSHSQQPPQSAEQQATTASSSPMMFERTVLPPFPPMPSINKASDSGCETTSGGFPAAGCIIAASGFTATITTTATPESSHLVSSSGSNHTAAGAPPNVPEVELASATNSPIMGDMDFLFSLDGAADFLENTSYNF